MQLRLRTKLTLIMTGLVLLVVAVLSAVFVAQLFEQVLQQTDKRAVEIANQVFEQARRAVSEAAARGMRPASNDPEDINEYVHKAFRASEGLRAQLKAAKVDTPAIYEVSVTNNDGKVLVSTDESLIGKFLPRRTKISQLTQRGYLHQAKVLAGQPELLLDSGSHAASVAKISASANQNLATDAAWLPASSKSSGWPAPGIRAGSAVHQQ